MSASGRVAERTLAEHPGLARLAPPIVGPDAPLEEVIGAMSRDPGSGVAFVTGDHDRLLGVVSERAVDLDLMTIVLPSDTLPLLALGPSDALRKSRGRGVTAGELMTPARSVTGSTTLGDAVTTMWQAGQRIAPLVEDDDTLLGYVRLFDVLVALLRDTSGQPRG